MQKKIYHTLGSAAPFGRELDFVHKDTKEILTDPIWNTLRDNNCFNPVVRQCLVQAEHKGQLKKRAKAIRVPSASIDRVLPHAFSHTPDVRHAQVDFLHECGRHVGGVPRSS